MGKGVVQDMLRDVSLTYHSFPPESAPIQPTRYSGSMAHSGVFAWAILEQLEASQGHILAVRQPRNNPVELFVFVLLPQSHGRIIGCTKVLCLQH